MLFNSLEFAVFFALVYAAYLVLPLRGQNTLLLLAGYVFYGWWDVRFLFLIVFSTCVDFWVGLMLAEGRVPARQRWTTSLFLVAAAIAFVGIDHTRGLAGLLAEPQGALLLGEPTAQWALIAAIGLVLAGNLSHGTLAAMPAERRRRVMIFVSVFVNLGFLAVFKYFNFFIDSAAQLIASLGGDPALFRLHIILPVGISFYTFQSLSYTLDVGRGLIQPTSRLRDFALFVAYFPPLVAGPIERARHLLPQLLEARRVRLRQVASGCWLILFGLFKKVAVADGVAPAVDAVFGSSAPVSGTDVAIATLLFAVQIYCDFSGYSDIARGVSRLMGIELMVNFRLPYFSKNPSEFWRRWHISLSSWLRDYLYIPLGGNRKGEGRTYANLMTTMVLGGLWHGAAWNYVLWGFYQGLLLCGHRLLTGGREARAEDGGASNPVADALRILFFFVFVCYGWLLFRAVSFDQIVAFTAALLGFGPSGLPSIVPKLPLSAIVGIALLVVLDVMQHRSKRPDAVLGWPRPLQGAVIAYAVFALVMGTSNAPVQFIYFQF
jgi:D-alanyl-lipoteichoic acid acyltransferase DltB (MBOAT superfamily)